jgi:hypothetical protein
VALSGFAGTMMSQLTFAAAAVVAGVVLPEADGLAEAPSAASLMLVECWPRTTMTIPMSSPSATGIAIVTAMRAKRLWLLRRRGAGLCPENIQPTSLSALPTGDTVARVRMTAARNPKDFRRGRMGLVPGRDSGNFLNESFRISNVAGQTICYTDEIVLLLAAEYGRYHSNVTDRLL